jgi:hypothetical protein
MSEEVDEIKMREPLKFFSTCSLFLEYTIQSKSIENQSPLAGPSKGIHIPSMDGDLAETRSSWDSLKKEAVRL